MLKLWLKLTSGVLILHVGDFRASQEKEEGLHKN